MPEESSIAQDIVLLVSRENILAPLAMELFSIAARVRRLERTLDELFQNAREDAEMISAASNVVRVEFRR